VVPGLSIGSVQGAFQPHLRGVGTTFFGPGIENPVALYVDDVYYSSQIMAPYDLYDTSQITVLKGPQGTLFGRNSTGGVIQMTTFEPEAQFDMRARTELGNYWTSRNFFYVTGGLTDDLKSNFSVIYDTQGNGWGTNLYNGNTIDKINYSLSVRNKWVWTPSDATTIKVNLDYTNRKDSFGPNWRLVNQPGVTGFFPGLGTTVFSSNPYDVTNVVTDSNLLQQGGGSFDIKQDLGPVSVRNILAFRAYDYQNLTDSTGSTEPQSLVFQHPTGHQFTEEFQLLSKSGGPFQWVAGLFYFNGIDDLPQDLIYFNYYSAAYYGFDGATAASRVDSEYQLKLTTNSLAFFGQGTLDLGSADHITGGLRHTNDRRSISGPINTYIDGVFDPDPYSSFPYDEQFTDSKWTWRAAYNHDFSKSIMGYASYNTGYKSGGFNAFFLAPPYQPETVDSYELGLKSELLDHTLRLNTAAFYNKYDNMQQLVISGLFLEVKNAASSEIYGIDFDGEWKASQNLTFTAAFEWLHARFTNFPNLPYSVAAPGGGIVSYAPGVLPERDGDGNTLPFAPTFTGDLAVNYTVPMSVGKMDFNVTDSYNSGFYWEPDNFAHQGSFNLVNVSATWTNGRLSVGLFGRNLSDQIVPSTVAATPPTGWLGTYGNAPRTYGVNAEYRLH
jgi:iron complex outermembrane recepter protein